MSIDTLLALTPEQRQAALIFDSAQDNIRIYEHLGYRWLSTSDASIQSLIRLDAPAELILPNHVAMLSGLLIAAPLQRVLNLGFGIGAFERFLQDRLPTLEIVSVDNNPAIVELARAHFFVPIDWPVLIQPAETYLTDCTQHFELILCDLFDGDRHAACLFEPAFHRHAARSLSAHGVLALNLATGSEPELVEILLALRQSFRWVLLVKIPQHGNVVVLACRQEPPSDEELARRAAEHAARLKLDFSAVLTGLEHLPPPAQMV